MKNETAAQGKVILLCGKIASGKSYYAKKLLERRRAVLLSMDELFEVCGLDFFNEAHNSLYPKLQQYLHTKSAELVELGLDVIFDSGFWSRKERESVTRFFRAKGVCFEWHYIDVSDETWYKNIEERNQSAIREGYEQFLIDEKRIREINTQFETPAPEEIDIWFNNRRE